MRTSLPVRVQAGSPGASPGFFSHAKLPLPLHRLPGSDRFVGPAAECGRERSPFLLERSLNSSFRKDPIEGILIRRRGVRHRSIGAPAQNEMTARISIIAALARNRTIGRDNQVPWRVPEDLKRFKQLTLGHAVIMGRKTFESIGTSLPGRDNIVITRSPDWERPGCRIARSFEAALALMQGSAEVFVIGGAEIYALALPLAARLYLTEIERDFEGDAFFPEFDRSRWREVSRESRVLDGAGGFSYHFVAYDPRA